MDSNKVALIIGGLLLAAFLAVPLLNPQGGTKPAGAASAGNSAGQGAAPAPVSTGPNLTEADLIGSTWRAETPNGALNVSLFAGGQLTAVPESALLASMLQARTGSSQVSGTWQVNGSNITLNAPAMGQSISVTGQIQGQNIMIQGQPAQRIN